MTKLTIDRGEWLTGAALRAFSGESGLCRAGNMKCCLGFLGKACGYQEVAMKHSPLLTSFEKTQGGVTQHWLKTKLDAKDEQRFRHAGQDVEDTLADINDKSAGIHPSRREAAIAYLFKKYGNIDVTFTGTYAAGTARARAAIKEAA